MHTCIRKWTCGCGRVYLIIQERLVVVCVALFFPVLAQIEDNEASVVARAKKARDFADVIRVQWVVGEGDAHSNNTVKDVGQIKVKQSVGVDEAPPVARACSLPKHVTVCFNDGMHECDGMREVTVCLTLCMSTPGVHERTWAVCMHVLDCVYRIKKLAYICTHLYACWFTYRGVYNILVGGGNSHTCSLLFSITLTSLHRTRLNTTRSMCITVCTFSIGLHPRVFQYFKNHVFGLRQKMMCVVTHWTS